MSSETNPSSTSFVQQQSLVANSPSSSSSSSSPSAQPSSTACKTTSVSTPSNLLPHQSVNKSSDRCLKCLSSRSPSSPSPWIYCSLCSSSWHWLCVTTNQLDPIDIIEKWFCSSCMKKDPNLTPVYNEPPRKSTRAKAKKINYSDSSNDPLTDPDRFVKLANSKNNVIDSLAALSTGPHKPFRRMKASEVSLEWLLTDPLAMTEPVIIDDKEGLIEQGMRMPSPDLTIRQIAELVGPDTSVEVIDVASQAELSRWTLDQWASYYENPKRDRVRNVISLEVSESPLGPLIEVPKIVKQMDWVQTTWPDHLRVHGSGKYPKVQKYCLMSVARCWTDWHIDFAGSSVFYHILRGAKTFYFIRPTVANLAKYEKWSGNSKLQESTWLGDQVNVVYKVSLSAGQTMMIPTGWIHAVHTPIDSLVFGGNFLHSLNIPIQLRIHHIENNTKVPKKFRFPFFLPSLWFVVHRYIKLLEGDGKEQQSNPPLDLDSSEKIPDRILSGLSSLSNFLLMTQTDSSDTHPAMSSSELVTFLQSHLNSDRIPSLRQTALKFENLVRSISPDPSSIQTPQVCATASPAGPPRIEPPDGPLEVDGKAFQSPLQIKIKRKLGSLCGNQTQEIPCNAEQNEKSNHVSDSKGNLKGRKNQEQKSKEPKQSKRSKTEASHQAPQTAGNLSSTKKKDNGEIVMISNPPPTTEVSHQRRKRPRFEDGHPEAGLPTSKAAKSPSGKNEHAPMREAGVKEGDEGHQEASQLMANKAPDEEDEPAEAHDEEVEVRTTRAENSVVRKWLDPITGKTVFETRTVKTMIEKAYFS